MSLTPGTRLGPYEILSAIGAGGMGEVYKANDTRLEREVAVKVLPSHLSDNPELKQRFEREAKAISQLTHPHICTLYDVGSESGVDFIVMELLEGQTLADRLDRGPLPTEAVLKFGVEIAGALDRAHRAGIVHRDLKPGNIMLTKAGVKLLDFGLARVAASKPVLADLSALPTQAAPSRPLTEKGTVMGTVQYMAPEQLEGKEADARTDIFAFGCILYEMATGKRAFIGTSHASLISAIMSAEPAPISALVPLTPPAFERVVKTCLAKDPEERWQSAHDVKSELEWIAQAGSQAGMPPVVASRRKSRERPVWIAAIVIAALASALLSRRVFPVKGESPGVVRFEISPPAGGEFQSAGWLSPDGRSVAFVAPDSARSDRLWVRDLASEEAKPIEGAGDVSNVYSLAWSPDARSIAIASSREIRRVALSGGTTQPVCGIQDSFGLSWGSSGVLVFPTFYGSGLFQVPASGGIPSPVTSLDRSAGEVAHLWPRFLADGRRFLFFARTKAGRESHQGWICSASLDTKGVKRIRAADSFVGVGEGHLLFSIAGSLYAQSFDEKTLSVRGEPAAIPGRPVVSGSIASASADVGAANLLFRSDPPKLRRLVWVDRSGRKVSEVGSPAPYQQRIAISPDGRRAIVGRKNLIKGENELWIMDLERGTAARSGSGVEEEQYPVWAPDGERVLFNWDRDGPYDLVVRRPDGSKSDEVIRQSEFDKLAYDWTRDGRFVLFDDNDPKNRGLAILTVGSPEQPVHVKGSERAVNFRLSPDGRWVLWSSAESGRRETYVQRIPEGSGRQQVSVEGGAAARFSPDGKEIFFVSPDAKLMATSFDTTAGAPRISIPSPLFAMSRAQLEDPTTWDVAPDGKRFLMLLPVAETDRSSFTVVLNWPAQLQ